MAYASVAVKDIIERSVNHKWSILEFQRGFVWKATQVRDLIESLWLSYPVGTLLVWVPQTHNLPICGSLTDSNALLPSAY